jgi:hypothetical protein
VDEAQSPLGQTLEARLDELKVVDDLHLRFRFKQPFPLLPRALGAVSTPTPFIMPERIARTDPFKQITEAIGSGPIRPTDRRIDFLMPPSLDEWLPQRHLARFVVEIVESLDLRGMSASSLGLAANNAAVGKQAVR